MSSRIETIADQRFGLFPVTPDNCTTTFQDILEEYTSNKELRPLQTAILPIEGLDKNTSAYNPTARIDPYGRLEMVFRSEPDSDYREDSDIQTSFWDGSSFVVTDFLIKKGSQTRRTKRIKYAQDPHFETIGPDQLALGYVEIECSDPQEPGKVTSFHEKIIPIRDEKLMMDEAVTGMNDKKDVRLAYVGNNRREVDRRERNVIDPNKEYVVSFNQDLILPADDVSSIEKQINIVAENPHSKIPTLFEDPLEWYGNNHEFAQSRNNGLYPVASIGHMGRLIPYLVCENGKPTRKYLVIGREKEFLKKTGEITHASIPQILVMADDFEWNIKPKRPDLEDVVFPGNAIFALNPNGSVAYTILFVGLKDRACGIALIRYPFSLPPDPKLNKDFICSIPQAKQFLKALEKKAA